MSWATEKEKAGRRAFQLVELDLDACSLTFGVPPCTAALPGAGNKCFNTFSACKDTPNFDLETKTYSFCSPEVGKSRAYDAIPSVRGVSITPMKLDPGLSLGKRGSAVVTFQDHIHHDRGIDKYFSERPDGSAGVPSYDPISQGSFFGKLTARNPHHAGRIMRVKTGFMPWDHDKAPDDQDTASAVAAIADVLTRTYQIERIDGPDAKGRVKITGKDFLKLADDIRAECPVRNTGILANGILSGVGTPVTSAYEAGNDLTIAQTGVRFIDVKNAGTHLFIYHIQNAVMKMERFDLSTPYDLSTAAFVTGQRYNVEGPLGGIYIGGMSVSNDGLHFFINGQDGAKRVFSFTMSVAWDLTTTSYDGAATAFSTGAQLSGISINDDGTRLTAIDNTNDVYNTYLLSSPYNPSTMALAGDEYSLPFVGGATSSSDTVWSPDGRLLLVSGAGFAQFISVPVPYDLSTAVYKGEASNIDPTDGGLSSSLSTLAIDEQKVYMSSNTVPSKVAQWTWSSVSTAQLTPFGVGNQEYSASGTLRIGDELMEYTRSGDTITFTERGVLSTLDVVHNPNDIVQECYVFDAQRIDLIIGTLLKDFAGISTTYIDEAAWATEAATYLPLFIYSALITEPTGVRQLVNELCQQSTCLLYWHETDAEFKFLALRRPITEASITDAKIIAGTLSQKDVPQQRLTRCTIRYGRVTGTARLDSPANFSASYVATDTGAESVNEFNDVRHLTLTSRWMGTGDAAIAQDAAEAILARYVTTPQLITFVLDPKDADIWTGSIIEIETQYEQSIYGEVGISVAQVVEVHEQRDGTFKYTAQSIQATAPALPLTGWGTPEFFDPWGGT